MKKKKFENSVAVLGRKCDMSETQYNFDRFQKAHFKEGEGKFLLDVSFWEDIPKSLSLHTNQLISQKIDSQRLNKERERNVADLILKTVPLRAKSAMEQDGNAYNPEECLKLFHEHLSRKAQELMKAQNELRTKKDGIENEIAKYSTKFKLYKCILPIETRIECAEPLTIKVSLKKDNWAPTDFTFNSTDLSTPDITNSLWDY